MAFGHPNGESILQPRDLGQILDRTFKVFFRSWRSLIPIGLIAAVPGFVQAVMTLLLLPGLESEAIDNPIVRLVIAVDEGDLTALYLFGGILLLVGLLMLLLTPLYQGALIDVTARAVLEMDPVPLGESFQVGGRRYLALLGTLLLQGLIWLIGLPLMALAGLLIFAIITIPVGATALIVFTVFTNHAIIIEGKRGGLEALKRSYELAKSRFWPLLGLGIVFAILVWLLQSILVTPFSFVTGMLAVVIRSPWVMALPSLLGAVATAITTPFMMVGLTLVYFDTRIRREGYDLEMMARRQQQVEERPEW